MSRIKNLVKNSPIHERKLEIRTFPLDGDRVVVEGWLRDERLITGYYWDGRPRPPGVVHHMCVRLLIGGEPISILDAEAEMPQVPNDICPTTGDSITKIIGIPIVSGFSNEVRRRLGGVEGCVHMMHLVLAMGPPALHGYWTHHSREPRPLPRSMDEVPGLAYLINSCQLWREDGPMLRGIQEIIEGGGQDT